MTSSLKAQRIKRFRRTPKPPYEDEAFCLPSCAKVAALVLWGRGALVIGLAVGMTWGTMRLRITQAKLQQQTVLARQEGDELAQLQAEEKAFQDRLTAAGLSMKAFETDATVTAKPLSEIFHTLEQEFPSTQVHYHLAAVQRLTSSRRSTPRLAISPFTTEAIEKASQAVRAETPKTEKAPFTSAQGATLATALVALPFTLELTIPRAHGISAFLNRFLHSIPGVVTFDRWEIHRQGPILPPDEVHRHQQASTQNLQAPVYKVLTSGRIVLHPDDAKILQNKEEHHVP